MATPAHLIGVPAGQEFMVVCGDGRRRHGGHWTDPARAEHWAAQASAAGCCQSTHQVVAVPPRGAMVRRGGWT